MAARYLYVTYSYCLFRTPLHCDNAKSRVDHLCVHRLFFEIRSRVYWIKSKRLEKLLEKLSPQNFYIF